MSSAPHPLTPDTLAPLLAEFLQRSFQPPCCHAHVEKLRLLTGGASRQTWSFDARTEQADGQTVAIALILRCDPPEGPQAVMSRALEFHTIQAAYAEGVLVPKPYFLGDDSLGVPFFIMERIEGETIPRRLFRDKAYDQARQVKKRFWSTAIIAWGTSCSVPMACGRFRTGNSRMLVSNPGWITRSES